MKEEIAFLEFQGVSKRYGSTVALQDLSFSIPQGVTCAFVGANGAGKTTTFSLVGTFIRPNAGVILVNGIPHTKYRARGGAIGLLPQDMQFFEDRSLVRQLKTFAELAGFTAKKALEEAHRVLELVGLQDRFRDRPDSLSHGMKVRLGVAQALIGSPPLVLLDEPTAGLDPNMRVSFRSWIEEIKAETTLVISSHELGELQLLCDYVCVIDSGRLVAQGSMEDFLGSVRKVRFHVESVFVDWLLLKDKYPNIQIKNLDEQNLEVHFDPSDYSLPDVNRIILGYLIEKGVGVYEVKSQRSLEQSYLTATGKGDIETEASTGQSE